MDEEITKEIRSEGIIVYRNEKGIIHNINDEPAVISSHGLKVWYKNDKRHRTKGPAIICIDGKEFWCYEDNDITDKVEQLMNEGRISSDWRDWTEEDEFLFILLIS